MDPMAGTINEKQETPMNIDLDSGDLTHVRIAIEAMVRALRRDPPTRARAMTITKLEEASMWASEALRVDP